MLAEVTALTSGIAGAVVLSVYSTLLAESGYLIPRTVPATSVIFSEPDIQVPRTSISRQSTHHSSHEHTACPRPIISLGSKIHRGTSTLSSKLSQVPLLNHLYKRFTTVQSKIAMRKARAFEKLGISCVFPRIVRPFRPTFEYLRCKLGLEDDGYMEAAVCNSVECTDPTLEDRIITRDRGMPNLDFMRLEVSTMADCFGDLRQINYGSRVLAKIKDDESCEDPQNKQICEELESLNRTLTEEECFSPGYVNKTY